MHELISIQPHDTLIQAVSARELHTFLQVQTKFADWIRSRIADYDFLENQDFVCVSENSETQRADGQRGVTARKEYYITLDMAKELSMVERNDKGKQARRYFIECEKRLKEQTSTQPVQPIGEVEDKLRAIVFALEHTTLSDVAKETAIITSAETLTGISIGYRPQIEQTTYSARELGDVLGISSNRVGRIANAHGLKTKEYGLYYLNKSPHSDKQVEHFRYFEKSIDKFKSILEND